MFFIADRLSAPIRATYQFKSNVLISGLLPMRCFFNLIGPGEIIRDGKGAEVKDLEEAQREALLAAEEVRREDEKSAQNWDGWRLEIVSDAGVVLGVITLGESTHSVARFPNAVSAAGLPPISLSAKFSQ